MEVFYRYVNDINTMKPIAPSNVTPQSDVPTMPRTKPAVASPFAECFLAFTPKMIAKIPQTRPAIHPMI